MYEKRHEPLASPFVFFKRMLRNILICVGIIALAVLIGMWGYHYFEDLPWIDAFLNASMILSSMGPVSPLQTFAGKLFAGFYALFSGLIFVIVIAIIFSPIIHRILHRFHLS